MLELGCREAMNLDGGGSTTMVINNKIANSPSDQAGERPVSDALLVFPR
jgi:exopolysaccharide biosynthesis protein